MRSIRIASIFAFTVATSYFFAVSDLEVNFDDLLSELDFSASTSATPSDVTEPLSGVDAAPVADDSVDTASMDALFEEMSAEDTAPAPEDLVVEPANSAVEAFDDAGSFTVDTMPAADAVETIVEEESVDFAPAGEAGVDSVVEIAPVVPAVPDASRKADAKLMAQQEEVRRQERELRGRKSFDAGIVALAAGNYDEAVKLLEDAKQNIPERPANDAIRAQIRENLSEAYTEVTRAQIDKDLTYARRTVNEALSNAPGNRRAQALEKRVSAREKKVAEEVARPKSVMEQKKYSDKYAEIDHLLREGRDLFDAREYNDAERTFEKVLILDEYNVEAMRFLRKIEERRFDIRTKEREATVAGMMAMVRDTWNPPIRTDVVLPPGMENQTTVDSLTNQQKLQKKMESIIIPSIEFRQANITDVVNFLVDASVAGDPESIGVNIILKLTSGEGGGSAPAPAARPVDDFGFGGDFGAPASDFGVSSAPPMSPPLR